MFDATVGVLEGVGLKRRFSHEKGEQNAANGPHVHFKTVPGLGENFRCYVVRSAAQCPARKLGIYFLG